MAVSGAMNRDPDFSCGDQEVVAGRTWAEVVHRRDSGLRNDAGAELHSLVLNLPDGSRFRQVTAVVALGEGDVDLVAVGSVVAVDVADADDLWVQVDLDQARAERGGD